MIYIIVLIMTFLGALASLFLKKASGDDGIAQLVQNWKLYMGGALYVISALLNIVALRYLDYSVVLPLTSITYVWTMILSYVLLKEEINRRKIVGISLIILGAALLAAQ